MAESESVISMSESGKTGLEYYKSEFRRTMGIFHKMFFAWEKPLPDSTPEI